MLVLKPCKDITPSLSKKTSPNYRTASLMNIDSAMLNRNLQIEYKHNVKKIIHHNQDGFILEMQGWFNILKSINVINHKMNGKTTVT